MIQNELGEMIVSKTEVCVLVDIIFWHSLFSQIGVQFRNILEMLFLLK